MNGKLSPTAQQQVAAFERFAPNVARLHSLVEQFAAARPGTTKDQIKASLKRAAGLLKIQFMTAGQEKLGQAAGSIELAVGRTGNVAQITRILRELIGSLKFQYELEIRTIIREDQEAAAKKHRAEESNSTGSPRVTASESSPKGEISPKDLQ